MCANVGHASVSSQPQQPQQLQQRQPSQQSSHRGLLVAAAVLVGAGSLALANLPSIRTVARRICARFAPDRTVASDERMERLETEQRTLREAIRELKALVEGHEGALAGRLLEVTQEVRELKTRLPAPPEA